MMISCTQFLFYRSQTSAIQTVQQPHGDVPILQAPLLPVTRHDKRRRRSRGGGRIWRKAPLDPAWRQTRSCHWPSSAFGREHRRRPSRDVALRDHLWRLGRLAIVVQDHLGLGRLAAIQACDSEQLFLRDVCRGPSNVGIHWRFKRR